MPCKCGHAKKLHGENSHGTDVGCQFDYDVTYWSRNSGYAYCRCKKYQMRKP